ncbi:MAG: DNA internalization-related competence protein ComEC/Rec2 [Ardenticatenaceae bacterium]|nr:DNA internalization-related competence protein ComEC/Rec2 [Ardenticatenaceae bacterium]MCB8946225.1 DNA internalization-related competence protein ComEC/Rec2 [Ardenticatenaceae bacterium]
MTIVYLGVAWLMGIWLASNIDWPISTWVILGILGLVGSFIVRNHINFRLWLVCLTAVSFGSARYVTAVPTLNEAHIATYNGTRSITLTGVVTDEPDVRDRSINLRVAVQQATLSDGTTIPVTGDILVTTFRFPLIEYGTELQITGQLETPPEGEDFNYKAYLARQDVHSLMALPDVTVLAEGQGNPFYQAIYTFKSRAQNTITQLIPNPQAGLLTGILLGNDNGLPPDLAEDFRTTGMTHIIAISGFNIAILIAILVGLAENFLSRRGAVIFAVSGIVLYTILVGADASVVRAAIMGGIYLIANRWLGRPNFAYASLFLSALLMTLVNPFTLWDVGFQLSFTATLGLMLYGTPFTQWTRRQLLRWLDVGIVNRVMGLLSEAVLITLAAQVLTLPLMMAYFGQLSLVSLAANAFILPAQPGVMLWGGLATLAGLFVPFIGQIFAWVAWLFLSYTIWLVRLFARVPGATVPVEISLTGIVLIYGVIAAVTWYAQQDEEQRRRIGAVVGRNLTQRLAVGASLLAAVLTVSWSTSQPDGRLHIAFMNVGQGDATLITTPNGRQVLIDGGFYPSVLNDQLGRQMPFWDREIDLMVATHPDADHVAGLVEVFDRYAIGRLITDGEGLGESPIYDEVLLAAEAAGTPIHPAQVGEVIYLDEGVRLEVLHPGARLNSESRNENSVSMRLVYEDFAFLFTGDAEEAAEREMLATGLPLQSLVFKAGHHGSRSSSTLPFLAAVRPQIMVVSAGLDNRFGHPHPELLERAAAVGTAVLRTDQLGTIEVITDGHTMWWQAVR